MKKYMEYLWMALIIFAMILVIIESVQKHNPDNNQIVVFIGAIANICLCLAVVALKSKKNRRQSKWQQKLLYGVITGGYDGLWNTNVECACTRNNLCHCDSKLDSEFCEQGYFYPCPSSCGCNGLHIGKKHIKQSKNESEV